MANREKIQAMAKERGRCLCSPLFSCECRWFTDKGECHCAGEGDMSAEGTKEWLDYNTYETNNDKTE